MAWQRLLQEADEHGFARGSLGRLEEVANKRGGGPSLSLPNKGLHLFGCSLFSKKTNHKKGLPLTKLGFSKDVHEAMGQKDATPPFGTTGAMVFFLLPWRYPFLTHSHKKRKFENQKTLKKTYKTRPTNFFKPERQSQSEIRKTTQPPHKKKQLNKSKLHKNPKKTIRKRKNKNKTDNPTKKNTTSPSPFLQGIGFATLCRRPGRGRGHRRQSRRCRRWLGPALPARQVGKGQTNEVFGGSIFFK